MCHSLVMNYGLYKKMEIFVSRPARSGASVHELSPPSFEQRAKPATKREMSQFHTDEYVDFLYRVTPDNVDAYAKECLKCRFFQRLSTVQH